MVGLLDWEFEDRIVLGAAVTGVDVLLWTGWDERDDLVVAGVDLWAGADCLVDCLDATVAFCVCDAAADRDD